MYRENSKIKHALTHWCRVTHICVSKLTIIGSDNGLSPDRRQAIIWTNAGLLLIGPLGTCFSEILIKILTFPLKKMHLKVSSVKRRPFCLSLNVLNLGHDKKIFSDIYPWSASGCYTVFAQCTHSNRILTRNGICCIDTVVWRYSILIQSRFHDEIWNTSGTQPNKYICIELSIN